MNIICKCHNGELGFSHFNSFENRNSACENMVRDAVKKYNLFHKNFEFNVNTADNSNQKYSFCTTTKEYKNAFPSFIFDGYPAIGFMNYDDGVSGFIDSTPLLNKIGWIGGPMVQSRVYFCNTYKNTHFTEALVNHWVGGFENLYKYTPTYMSYQQQIDRWKYLIDIEGAGWSARLPVLLSSPRIVFIVDRPYEEWWFEALEPWKHYVPVKRDFSDIEKNFNKLTSDPKLELYIKEEVKIFCKKYLTRDSQLDRIKEIIIENSHEN